jgi:hypothetical protein
MTTKRTTPGPGGLRAVFTAVMVAFAAVLALVGSSTPASAHSGGKAVVLVRSFTLTPSGDAWDARLQLADLDSGAAIIAADAKVTVGTAAQAALEPVAAEPGVYTAKLTKLKAGPADVRLVVRSAPGGVPVAVFDRTYPGTNLSTDAPTVVTAEAAGGGGGSNTGMIVGVAGAVLLVALLYGLFSMRRRGAVPARAK